VVLIPAAFFTYISTLSFFFGLFILIADDEYYFGNSFPDEGTRELPNAFKNCRR
jgi:hypothetical protein